jgi:hypothetical protein
LAEVCKLKYSIKKLGEKIQALCMVFTLGEICRRYFLNFRRYLKIRLRAVRGSGGGSS